MSALSDLQKKLEKESQGIMFPFSANASTVSTTQNVYDSATDGIMTMTGQKYVGPDAVVQYGTEEQGYPRNLKQIEAPMLPQVSNLPPQGTGIMEAGPGTSTPSPIVEQPKTDPCPPGYRLVNGVCQLIEQQPQQDRGKNRPTFTGPKISKEGIIDGYKSALSRAEGAINAGGLNSMAMKRLEEEHGAAFASKVGLLNQKYRNRGVQISKQGLATDDPEIKRLQTVYGQERVDKDYTLSADGKYYRIVATSPKPSEVTGDMIGAIVEVVEGYFEKGPILPKIANDLLNYFNKDKPSKDFGKLTGADTFGQLQRNIDVANLEITAATEALQQIANSTKYREERTDDQIDGDIRAQQRKIEKAKQTIEESNDMMQGTSAKEDRKIAARIASDINRPEEIARKAAQRKTEKENRAKQGGFKTSQQRTKDFKKLSKDLSSFRKNFMKNK
jgi:hypothetical protein